MDTQDPILGFFVRWVEEFTKHWEEVMVICLREGEHSLPENVRVLSLGKESGTGKLTQLLRFYRYIWRERKNYDSVFVHMNPEYIVLGGVFWRLQSKRIGLWYTHKSVDVKLRIAEKLTHIIFTASGESFRLKSRKTYITGHGIDVEEFKNKGVKERGEVLRIISAGRISPTKDYKTLLQACAELTIPYHVRIVGEAVTDDDMRYADSLGQYAKDLGIVEYVEFSGPVAHSSIPDELARADIFVNLSKTGSLDKAILEAMSVGVIPITANEAFSTILPRSLQVKPQNSKQLTEALERNASLGTAERKQVTNALREYVVSHHSLPTLIGNIVKYYEYDAR